jgi:hypothetical protein
MIEDAECWIKYPHLRNYFNKLWFSDQLDYNCGPCGVPVPQDGKYVIRPIYNLSGMGRGAKIVYLKKNQTIIKPGYFWCEYFEGPQYSIDYKFDQYYFKPILAVEGIRDPDKLYKFLSWKKTNKEIYLQHPIFFRIKYAEYINVEFIGEKPIEIHFRRNPDFLNHDYNEIKVVWASDNIDISSELISCSQEEIEDDKRLGFIPV